MSRPARPPGRWRLFGSVCGRWRGFGGRGRAPLPDPFGPRRAAPRLGTRRPLGVLAAGWALVALVVLVGPGAGATEAAAGAGAGLGSGGEAAAATNARARLGGAALARRAGADLTPEQLGALLLTDVAGFEPDPAQSGTFAAIAYRRSFVSGGSTLQLIAYPGQPGASPTDAAAALGAAFGAQGEPFATEPLVGAQGYVLAQGPDAAGYVLIVAARDVVFVTLAALAGAPGPTPEQFLIGLAQRQVDRAGGPPPVPAGTATTGKDQPPDELEALLIPEPPPRASGERYLGGVTMSGLGSDAEVAGLDAATSRFLGRHSEARARAWATASGAVTLAVSVTRYPDSLFAAASLERQRHGPDRVARPLPGMAERDVVTFEGTAGRAGIVGGAFRRGRDLYTVLARPGDGAASPGPGDIDATVADTLTAQLAIAGPGATSAYALPSPGRAALSAALIVTIIGAGSCLVGRLRAHRAQRRRLLTPPRARSASSWLDVSGDARRLRGSGVGLLVAQLASVDVAVGGVVAFSGPSATAAALGGPAVGLAVTAWWRRRELARIGAALPDVRPVERPAPAGVVLGVVALGLVATGAGVGLGGVRGLVGLPTLRLLEAADLLRLSTRVTGALAVTAALAAIAGGTSLLRLARQLGRQGAVALRAADHRPPILYLRSFEDDALKVPTVVSARRPFLELFTLRGDDPFEEAVTWELAPYGPVVAIGQPGRRLAPLGAARAALPDGTWRQSVAAVMAEALAVVVSIGETPGLEWEVRTLVERGHLHKTLFLFPPEPGAVLARRWAATCEALTLLHPDVGPLDDVCVVSFTAGLGRTPLVAVADRRDEATYRSAIDRAFERLVTRGVAARFEPA